MEPEITDDGQNRKITAAEALKRLDEVKTFVEINGSNHLIIELIGRDHLNMICNKLIENLEQMTLKNQKQSGIRSFFRF